MQDVSDELECVQVSCGYSVARSLELGQVAGVCGGEVRCKTKSILYGLRFSELEYLVSPLDLNPKYPWYRNLVLEASTLCTGRGTLSTAQLSQLIMKPTFCNILTSKPREGERRRDVAGEHTSTHPDDPSV